MPKLTTKKSTVSRERLNFIEPMYARSVQQLPEVQDWLYEVKLDGYRCLAGRDSTGVTLWSRGAIRFTDQFPTLSKACEHLQTDTCPFANLPEKKRTQWALTREQMRDCVWLKPELVARVEFTEWTPDGHLRHSKFCGLRYDNSEV